MCHQPPLTYWSQSQHAHPPQAWLSWGVGGGVRGGDARSYLPHPDDDLPRLPSRTLRHREEVQRSGKGSQAGLDFKQQGAGLNQHAPNHVLAGWVIPGAQFALAEKLDVGAPDAGKVLRKCIFHKCTNIVNVS